MSRRDARRFVPAIILSTALGLAVASPARSQSFLILYDEFGTHFASDSPQPARVVSLPPLIVNLGGGHPPDTILRCGVRTQRDGEGRRGVPFDVNIGVFEFDAEGSLVGQDSFDDRGRTNRHGWDHYTFPPTDVELDPDSPYLFVVNLELRGGRSVDTVDHQCLLGVQTECDDDGTTACVPAGGPRRFQVDIAWEDPFNGQPRQARVVDVGKSPATSTDPAGGFVEFQFSPLFDQALIKILDGCNSSGGDFKPFNNFWVFSTATTDVEYTLTVTDTQTGATKLYFNESGQPAPAITDTSAFATCP